MKKNFILCILVLSVIGLPMSGQADLQLKYQKKVSHYNQMKKVGTSLIVCGSVFAVTGTVVTVRAGNKVESSEYFGSEVKNFVGVVVGVVFITVGVVMDAAGIPLTIIGNQKSKQYQNMLKNLRLGVICNPEMQGVSLVYRF